MNFINMDFRKSTLLLLLVALTIFVSLSAISAADVNNDGVEFATFSNESGEIDGGAIYIQSLHDVHDDLPDIELIKQPSTAVDNLEDKGNIHGEFIDNTTAHSVYCGAIRPSNILTYDYIPYENILFVDGDSHNLIIEDAPQNIDFSKCRSVTIFSKLSGVTGTVSVPEGYMIVIDGNNLTLKHM